MAAVKKEVAGPALEGVVESPNDDVVVLSDADEGFFQWLAVNYRMGIFSKEISTQPHDSQTVLGVVDLDDASTQMAFVPQIEEQNVEDVTQRMAFGHNYHLYSHSHLCYGMTTIGARYQTPPLGGGTVASLCHQRGLTVEVASDDIFQTPCATSAGEDVMSPSIPKPSVVRAKIKFKGDYSASTCGRVIAAIFANGSFAKVHHPRLKGNFTAVHKLGEIVTSYKKANQTGKVTRTDFAAEIDKFCTRKWTNLSPEEQDTAEDRCLEGWIVRELMEAYGFKNDTDW
ncbi:Ectonucleoside triphosphate diphosphohydrolase 8 [Taenia solium]|eukprot:TsM_001136500 transcript=TsM_001136500 gene=TsM_001136500